MYSGIKKVKLTIGKFILFQRVSSYKYGDVYENTKTNRMGKHLKRKFIKIFEVLQ